MLPDAFRALFVGGLLVGLTTGVGCTAKDDPTPGTGGSTTAGGNGGLGGTAGAGGSGGFGGVAGTPGPTGGVGGGTGGAPTGGSAGTPSAGAGQGGTAGTPSAGGVGGSAGTPPAVGGTPGAGTGGTAGETAGSAGSAGAAGGGAGGAAATLVEPILRNGNYVLEFGSLYFEVAPAGARIMDVHLSGGMNLLTGASVNATNFGSTFWTAPQSVWSWPPPAEVDTAAYTATVASPSVTFVGPSSAAIGASITKKFTADLAKGVVNAEYTIIATAAGNSFAPWEVTRVAQRGITFWPTGGAPTGTAMPPTTTGAGCTWHTAPSAPPGTDQKLFADGTGGWLAYVDGDTLIVKKFPDIMASQAAPAEAEIELYVSGTAPYMELEQQGAYGALAMGASATWTVTWYVVKLPTGLTASVGSQPLVDYVQSLIQ